MAHIQTITFFKALLVVGAMTLTSCHSRYSISKVEGKMISMDSIWDASPDSAAVALLAPYKATIDSMMNRIVGVSETDMVRKSRESLLSNLVADVLRESAAEVIGKPANIGIVNMGGLRNDLAKGDITYGNIFEILPFENSLCVLTVSGQQLNEVFAAIAQKGGDGLSGAELVITKNGKVVTALVDGKPVETDRIYTIATIDYLADGNDGMAPLAKADKRVCPPDATLRSLFLKYVEQETKKGKMITSRIENRILVN